MSFIPFKFKKANGPTRLADFDTQPTWGDLASKITKLFEIPMEVVGVAYVDKSKDAISLYNEQDLQRFYKSLDQNAEEIKFVVQDLRAPDAETTITSTWSMDSNMSELSKSDGDFKLVCWVLELSKFPFQVKIGGDQTVGDLKEEIKKNNVHKFAGVDADDLDLWKLSTPVLSSELDVKLGHIQHPEKIAGSVQLNFFDELSKHFLSPPRHHVHIVVKLPDIFLKKLKERKRMIERDGTDEGSPPKRPKVDSYSPLSELYRQSWGILLDPALTTFPPITTDLDNDEVDDVLPGNPFLNVLDTKFLVRAEYIRVFNEVELLYERSRDGKLAVITGQPGIGKTFWINYALRRCLGEKKPVIWYLNPQYYFFSDTGVEIINPADFRHPKFTWCFVDSTHADRLPITIYDRLYRLFPIYSTSPKEERWNKLEQQRNPNLVIMNPWTRAELEKAAVLFSERTSEEISERFNNAGPTARLCLEYSSTEIRHFYAARKVQINLSSPRHLISALLDKEELRVRMGDVSHKICVVRRSKSESSSSPFTVEPISPIIRRLLLTQLWEWKEEDHVAMIERFSRIPSAGGIVGILFESLHQHRFAKEINVVAAPMFRTGSARSCWHTTSGDFSAFPMLRKAREALNTASPLVPQAISLKVSPLRILVYMEDELLTIQENIYYVPFSETEVAIDSFIVHAGHLYLFQFTSGIEHGVNLGLMTKLTQFSGLPAAENRHFIFVVPKYRTNFQCPHSNDGFLHDHIPYVAHIDS